MNEINRRTAIQAGLAVAAVPSTLFANNLGEVPDAVYFLGKDNQWSSFTREAVQDARRRLVATHEWDFCTALGDTIKEKYEHLIRTVRSVAGKRTEIITSPEISAIFETAAMGFEPCPSEHFIDPLEASRVNMMVCVGKVTHRGYTLRLHKDFLFPSSKLLLVERDVSNGLEITVTNFVL